MSGTIKDKAERLQEAIGLIKDEYVDEAHGNTMTGETTEQAAAMESNPNAAQASKSAEKPAKVISMPAQRRRRKAAVPIGIAACLVIALGVGALAFTSMNRPAAEDEASTKTYERTDGEAALSAVESATEAPVDGMVSDSYREPSTTNLVPGIPQPDRPEGEAFILTAGEWNDNANWAFFTNLVNSNTIRFPVFGLDPTRRVQAKIVDAGGNSVRGEEVALLDGTGAVIWRGTSDKDGNAFLFYNDVQTPASVSAGGVTENLVVAIEDAEDQQGAPIMQQINDVTLTVGSTPASANGLQVRRSFRMSFS